MGEENPRSFPFSQSVQYIPAKLAYFQQEAAQPLKNPSKPSILQIRDKFLIILPDHFYTPDNSYLAQMTPKGLATIALAILAKAEAANFAAWLSGMFLQMVLSKQKQTALLSPVFHALTTKPLQNDFQPSSAKIYLLAKQTFLRKLEVRESLLGGTIRAILMLSRG